MFSQIDDPEIEAEFAYIGELVVESRGLGVDFIFDKEPSSSEIGKRWLSTYIPSIQEKICTKNIQKKIDRLYDDDIAVIAIIADAIAPLFMVVPPFTVAKIITRMGYARFCNSTRATDEK